MDKIKHALHIQEHNPESSHSSTSDPDQVHDRIRTERTKHEEEEARADEIMHERQVDQASEPNGFVPPYVVNQREPLSSYTRESLNDVVHHEHHPPGPDMYGGTHLPEKDLPKLTHEAQNTAVRPSDPQDPTAMDGAPTDPTSAGDDYAI
ncbi:hypothetical protein OIO90_003943 [Microbotryomycetes sp. JL221]|nr:hypothetical protein OIO90_003943 [Microbotryomycetes sp. JL221]